MRRKYSDSCSNCKKKIEINTITSNITSTEFCTNCGEVSFSTNELEI